MAPSNIDVLKLMGNKVNARIITLIRRQPMSPRDLSKYLNKKEGDIVRRLKAMEKCGLVKGSWGSRLGQNVKLYSLVTNSISVTLKHNGLKIALGKDEFETSRESTVTIGTGAEEEQQQPSEELPIVGRAGELKAIRESEKANFFSLLESLELARLHLQESMCRKMRFQKKTSSGTPLKR